jgi:hypothetical protein
MLFRYAIIALSNYFEIQVEKRSPAKVIHCRMRFHSTVAICSFAETLSASDDFIYSVYSTNKNDLQPLSVFHGSPKY